MVSKTMFAKLLLAFVSVNTILDYGESSYSAISDYHHKIRRMASIKASFISRNGVPPIPIPNSFSTAPVISINTRALLLYSS